MDKSRGMKLIFLNKDDFVSLWFYLINLYYPQVDVCNNNECIVDKKKQSR